MKRIIAALFILFLGVGVGEAGEMRILNVAKFSSYEKSEGVYSWADIDPVIGIATYQDDVLDGVHLAYYAQIPIVKYDDVRINFGVIITDELADELSRPTFSVSYLWTDTLNLPSWVGLETGVYYALGPYNAWGFQLGLLRLNW